MRNVGGSIESGFVGRLHCDRGIFVNGQLIPMPEILNGSESQILIPTIVEIALRSL